MWIVFVHTVCCLSIQLMKMDQTTQIQRLTETIQHLQQEVDMLKDRSNAYRNTNNVSFVVDSNEVDDTVYDQRYIEPTCWRCGQKGHIKKGCVVRLDHSRRHAAAYRVSQRYDIDLDAYRPYDSRYSRRARVAAATPAGLVGNSNEER